MARDLHADMQTLSAVLTFVQNRDFERAGALAEQTLAGGFEHPLLLNVVATRFEQQGKFEDALRLLERAVSIAPSDVGARNALSLCLQRLDRPAEALNHIDELLKKHPGLGFAHANRGNALIALGSMRSAKLSHMRGLQLEPGNFASMAALASIATQRGEHDDARRWAERALSASPGLPVAIMSLAAAELASGAVSAAEALLHRLIIDSRAGPEGRAHATGLLGDVLDAAGRYAEACDAYSTCNEALQQIHRRFAHGMSALAYTRALIASASTLNIPLQDRRINAAPEMPGEALGHVFLLGFPRSGMALLQALLGDHPQVAGIDEHELLTAAALRFMREPSNLELLVRADESQLHGLRALYWDGVRKAGVDTVGKMVVDTNPLNTLKLPLIARLFPRAKILFACRDPRDVVLSCFRHRFKMNAATYELLTLPGAAALYDAVMSFADHVRPLWGLYWQAVRYERLVADPAHETAAICEFLGLERVAGIGEQAAARTAIKKSDLQRWRRYDAALRPILPALIRWVEHFGYPV
ncbi:MAG: tetratricopeptide repeat protein [Steroidobacteraceae bacterium]